jgi:hypothetical protein
MKTSSNVVAWKRRESEPIWLDSNNAEFVENARRLISAKGRAARDRLLRDGPAGKFAARLLGEALRHSERQVECWKLVAQLYAHDAWRRQFRIADADGTLPSPRSFSKIPLAPIVQAVLGLCGEHALDWCIGAYLTRTGPAAERIAQAIIAGAFKQKAIIGALGPALKDLEAERKVYDREIVRKIASLLSRSLSTRSSSGRDKSAAPKVGSITLTRAEAGTLIQALLSARSPDETPPDDNLGRDLAETAWMEADEALARALQQTPALREAIRDRTQLSPRLRNHLGEILQAVSASAEKRELEIEGEPGSETTFDPAKHAQDDSRVKVAERVRIVTPTVFQGRGTYRRVLRVADVEPA